MRLSSLVFAAASAALVAVASAQTPALPQPGQPAAPAAAMPVPPAPVPVGAKAWLLMDFETGQILAGENYDQRMAHSR